MKTFEWKDADNSDCSYFYDLHDGKIAGQVHKIVHTKIWLSKIITNDNQEKYLGQYISESHSKAAVEKYWMIELRTLVARD